MVFSLLYRVLPLILFKANSDIFQKKTGAFSAKTFHLNFSRKGNFSQKLPTEYRTEPLVIITGLGPVPVLGKYNSKYNWVPGVPFEIQLKK